MIDTKALVPQLQKQVEFLTADLLTQSLEVPEVGGFLRGEYAVEREAGRSARGFEEWRDDQLEQVAVAWVLSCVFVRFIEDNSLINECYLAGDGDRGKHAEGSYDLYFRQHPYHTDREYLKFVFTEIGKLPSAKELFQKGKTALWAVDPSGDGAMRLLQFFKQIDPEAGGLRWTFHTFGPDTTQSLGANTGPLVILYQGVAKQAQFLGDLYQDLSVHARKKYALLQTPEFIQTFILDRTLTAALDQFGLKNLRLIDPACGSGHFLLGAFERLFHEWMKPEHGVNNEVIAAQNALDSVFGVDINPFAVAITRFRLIVAAVVACRINKLNQQSYAWRFNLAIGDSLLWGSKPTFAAGRTPISRQGQLFEDDSPLAVETPGELRRILGQGYHVVVGNPPYITVKDKAQNEAYRKVYSTCHGKYSLGVPFTQRFWDLAIQKGERIRESSEEISAGAGYIGLITANSFMKREFGSELIEEFFPKTDLTHVIDTSRAYIPGHGTPTVILLGRPRKPVDNTVRAVLGIKGEPATPHDPALGLVWQSILKQIDVAGAQDDFTSTADVPRETFSIHPWSIGGGGAAELKEQLDDSATQVLGVLADSIGFASFTGQDDAFVLDRSTAIRQQLPTSLVKIFIEGDAVRDFKIDTETVAFTPYDSDRKPITLESLSSWYRLLWPLRRSLETVVSFGHQTRQQLGEDWWTWYRWVPEKYRTPLSITFAEVASHNHFVLDRGGKVFKQTAPIIKLPADATEDDHFALLGLLNSSTACFWMKQVFYQKATAVGDISTEKGRPEANRYAFASTGLLSFPLPSREQISASSIAPLASAIDQLAKASSAILPSEILRAWQFGSGQDDLSGELNRCGEQYQQKKRRMIALQEELDWEVYKMYGLTDEGASERIVTDQQCGITPEHRPFHWLSESPPDDLPVLCRAVYEKRWKLIRKLPNVKLIETLVFKRPWWGRQGVYGQASRTYEDWVTEACYLWLLDRLETPTYRKGTKEHPEFTTTAQMADVASADAEFLEVAALYRGRPDFNVATLVAELVEAEAVPFLPIVRYKPAGLRKREVWERTWDLQRQQDAGEDVGDIPVPPKYTSADFLKADYWRLRGKLDVPKERWVSYPHCSTDSDPTLVVGWAGWNHLEQATALIAYYDARKRDGWDEKRLTPLLAGLGQLLPWVRQWHTEIDAEFGETAGQSFQTMLEHDAHELGLTVETVRTWTPPEKPRKARTPGKKKTPAGERDDA